MLVIGAINTNTRKVIREELEKERILKNAFEDIDRISREIAIDPKKWFKDK